MPERSGWDHINLNIYICPSVVLNFDRAFSLLHGPIVSTHLKCIIIFCSVRWVRLGVREDGHAT